MIGSNTALQVQWVFGTITNAGANSEQFISFS